jgi:hypothetical protein
MISTAEVREVVEKGEIIEDYPEDARGHSCLMLGRGKDGQPIHIVCAPKDEYLAVITAYIPNESQWSKDFRKRVRS